MTVKTPKATETPMLGQTETMPKVGQIIRYYTRDDDVTLAAIVAQANGDWMNLAVLEPSGVFVNRTDVLFVPSPTSRAATGAPEEYCSWPD